MVVEDPICKSRCVDCEYVDNKWFFSLFTKHRADWKCKSKKEIYCRDGEVKFANCYDNLDGDCPRFSPK